MVLIVSARMTMPRSIGIFVSVAVVTLRWWTHQGRNVMANIPTIGMFDY